MPATKHVVWGACTTALMLAAVANVACVTPGAPVLEIVSPFRMALPFGPSLFGQIVLPPERRTAEVRYAGDACESFVGRIAARGTAVLVDRYVRTRGPWLRPACTDW